MQIEAAGMLPEVMLCIEPSYRIVIAGSRWVVAMNTNLQEDAELRIKR